MKWWMSLSAAGICVLWLLSQHSYYCVLPKESPSHMARRDVNMLVVAMIRYESEFGPPPYHEYEPGAIYGDQHLVTDGPLMKVLLGSPIPGVVNPPVILNDLRPASSGRGGLILGKDGESPKYVDPWGNPYIIVVDANRDKAVRNPDSENQDEWIRGFAPHSLAEPLIVYSKGPDGLDNTADDCTSWRSAVRPPTINPVVYVVLVASGALCALVVMRVAASIRGRRGMQGCETKRPVGN